MLPCWAVLREAFVVRYEAGGGGSPGLASHRDGHPLSFSVLLNAATEFDGGGTQLDTIGETARHCHRPLTMMYGPPPLTMIYGPLGAILLR